jgi:hypothetical protein
MARDEGNDMRVRRHMLKVDRPGSVGMQQRRRTSWALCIFVGAVRHPRWKCG